MFKPIDDAQLIGVATGDSLPTVDTSNTGANHSKSLDLRERVVALSPVDAIGVKSAENGDCSPANNCAATSDVLRPSGHAGRTANRSSQVEAVVDIPVTADIGEPIGDILGHKLAGVTKPPTEDDVGVGSKLAVGRTMRLSGAKGHTEVRHAEEVAF